MKNYFSKFLKPNHIQMLIDKTNSKDLAVVYDTYLNNLFQEAWNNNPLHFVFTLVRVTGIQYGHWDPLEETFEAFEEYQYVLERSKKKKDVKNFTRQLLLQYCHLIEASAPYEFILNLLRCKNSESFDQVPFFNDRIVKKENPFEHVPASVKKKVKRIKTYSTSKGDNEISLILDQIINEKIRNAFFHSDYCLTENDFRITEGGFSQKLELAEIYNTVFNAFTFYSILFQRIERSLSDLSKMGPYIKMPQYEVLELISENSKVVGFKIHFSNGSNAFFKRTKGLVDSVNIFTDSDRTVGFMVGDVDKLVSQWKINGIPVLDFEKANKEARNEIHT